MRRIGLTLVAGVAFLAAVPGAFAALGDVVNSFVSARPDEWQGAACYANGYVWDCGRNKATLYQRDPVSGAIVGTLPMPSAEVGGVTWDTANGTWWITEPWDEYESGDILELPATGGDPITSLEPHLCGDCGICYDPQYNELWVIDNCYSGDLYRFNKSGGATFHVDDPPCSGRPVSICRVGDHLWLGNMVNGSSGEVQQCTFSDPNTMTLTGVKFSLPDSRIPLALSFDGQYLWVYTNKDGYANTIYQVDIEYATPTPPTTPTPTPTAKPSATPSPTPVIALIDSGDYDGDGTSDAGLFRASAGFWAVRNVTRVYRGTVGDIPACGDYDNDGKTEVALYRPSRGMWSVHGLTTIYYGASSDIPVPGDWDGDGFCDVGVFKPSSGLWAIRNVTRVYFGASGDVPVPFYKLGTREKSFAVWRPSTGKWATRGEASVYLGARGDYPVPADYSGEGMEDPAIFRCASGLWLVPDVTRVTYGTAGDWPAPADYTGDRRAEVAVYRPNYSIYGGYWAIRGTTTFTFGVSTDVPVCARPCWPVTPTPVPPRTPTPAPSATPAPTTTPAPTLTPPPPTPVPTLTPPPPTPPPPTPIATLTPPPVPTPTAAQA